MKYEPRSWMAAVFAAVLLGIATGGCGVQNVTTSSQSTLVSIEITPSDPGMAPGTTLQLTALGMYSNKAAVNLTMLATWSSSNSGIATVGGTGLVISTDLAGSTTITASYKGISGSTLLTTSPVASIAVTPVGRSIAPGTTLQFTATGTLQNGATQNLTTFVSWNSSDTNAASITGTGLAAAKNVSTTITTTISAAFGGIEDFTSLTVSPVVSINVIPASASIPLGTTQQFTAMGTLANSAAQNLTAWATWNSSNPAVASINSTGLATSISQGTTAITAKYSGITSNAATLTITAPILQSITITPTSASIAPGLTQQFTATGAYSDGSTQNITESVTWTSSNETVATVSAGLATTLTPGTTTITAKYSGITSNAAALTVTAAVLTSITVTPSNPTILIGLTQQFSATGTFSDGATQNMTATVNWNSSNSAVAIMSPTTAGLAISTGIGQTTITATSGDISGSTTLTVTVM